MMNKHFLFIRKILWLTCTVWATCLYGQNSKLNETNTGITDSSSLSNIISIVIQNHPSVKECTEAINSADEAILLAKTGYYPNVDAKLNYTRLGPVTSISFPGFGTFDLFPANNYSAGINVYQNIYDFGKTNKNVAYASESKNLATQSLGQMKQKLALMTVMHYYSLMYLQEAFQINKEEQKTLQEQLAFIQKKNETGSATQYEILSTKVKLSSAENAGIEIESNLENQISELNVIMGQEKKTTIAVKKDLEIKLPENSIDSLISYALAHRDEMQIALEKKSMTELKYKMVRLQNNPSLNLYLSGGAKNGYLPEMNNLKANYSAGLGLVIPIFDGMRTKNNLLMAQSSINSSIDEIELARLNVINDVTICSQNLKSSLKKVEHNTLQLTQAEEAFTLAQVNYKAGIITNLDLLNAATAVSESKLSLYKSKVDYALNAYKLKAAIGEKLY